MELLQLKYFVTVAKHQNMTKAADELYIAQPAISQSIGRLEKEFGTQLFDRIGKNIILNKNGQILLKYATTIFQNIEQMKKEMEIAKNVQVNPIHISSWRSSSMIPNALAAFKEAYPYIELFITDREDDANVDFRFVTSSFSIEPYPCDVLVQEDMLLAVSINHRLAKFDSVPLSDVKDAQFAMQPQGKPLRTICEDFCKKAGFTPHISFEVDNFQSMKQLIHLNNCVSFVPSRSWGNVEYPEIKLLKIVHPLCIRSIYLSWDKDRILSYTDNLFRSFIRDFFKSI